jgi:hypothetical protein
VITNPTIELIATSYMRLGFTFSKAGHFHLYNPPFATPSLKLSRSLITSLLTSVAVSCTCGAGHVRCSAMDD